MFSALYATLKHNSALVINLILGLLLLLVGWHLGRITSPYYASHPIVFSEPCTETTTTSADLVDLQPKSAQPEARPENQVVPIPQPEVASAITGQQFVGSQNSNLYHLPDCPSANRIKIENQIWFKSQEEAKSAGYSPSKCTQEKLR